MPDKDMPINDYGVIADIVIGPEAVFNRMNLGQLYEHFINAMSFFVMQRILETDDLDTQYVTLLEYLSDVNIEYAACVDRVITSQKRKQLYMREVVNSKKIHIVIPPFLSTLTPDWVLEMTKKYNVHATPVEYNMRDSDGNFLRKVRTLRPVFISQKYLYILCKIPHSRSCGMTYVNQLNVPIRPKSKKSKSQYPIGLVPIRMGEDENRNLQMVIGPMAFRILSLYANSPEATNKLTETLLTHPKPTQLTWVDMTEAQLCAHNNMIKVAKHMLATCGIDAENVLLTKEKEQQLHNRLVELGGK